MRSIFESNRSCKIVISFVLSVIIVAGLGLDALAASSGHVSVIGDSVSTHSDYESFATAYSDSFDANYMYYNLYIKATKGTRGKVDAMGMTRVTPVDDPGDNYVLLNPMNSQERIDKLDDNGTPDTILVFGGLNDIANGVQIEDFKVAYVDFLKRINDTYPSANVICMTAYEFDSYAYGGRKYTINDITPYNNIIKECVGNANNATVIDLSNVDIESDTFDNVHPNKEGHIKMFNKLMENEIEPPSGNYSGLLHTQYGTWMYSNGQIDMSYTGYASDKTGTYYIVRGYYDSNYTGMYYDGSEWVYLENGKVNISYTGEATNAFGTWYYENGHINWNANGMINTGNRWRMLNGGHVETGYTGMANNIFGWWYFTNGDIDWSYTGMANNIFGWWYYVNGRLDWIYTGEGENVFGTWYYENGRIKWDANGMYWTGSRWRMLNGGHVETGYTGMASNIFGWWYFTNGDIDWTYTGEGENVFGTWYYENGHINWNANGMINTGNRWRMLNGGHVETGYTGMANNIFGWWYFINGDIDWTYTGMANNIFGWWYYTNGRLDWSYTGVGENVFGKWLYVNGRIPFDYYGQYTIDGVTYNVQGGHIE